MPRFPAEGSRNGGMAAARATPLQHRRAGSGGAGPAAREAMGTGTAEGGLPFPGGALTPAPGAAQATRGALRR